jgi:hypothetical protein
MLVKVISSCSIKAFRYRVHALEQDLWKAVDPVSRANLALQLADAATTLARLEMQEAQRIQQDGLEQASDRNSDRNMLADPLPQGEECLHEGIAPLSETQGYENQESS